MSVFQRKTLLLLIGFVTFLISACTTQAAPAGSGKTNEPTPVVVRLLNLDIALQVTPTLQPTFTPLPTQPPPTPSSTSEQLSLTSQTAPPVSEASPTPACQNRAEFVRHLNISENSVVNAGESYAKLWQIRNVGDCVWSEAYRLVLVAGDSLGEQPSLPLPSLANPGDLLDLRVTITAPTNPGTYSGSWMIQNSAGVNFGTGEDSLQPLQVTIVVKPPLKPTPG